MGWQNSIFSLVIINAGGGFSGLFVYSPAPGAGNLIASIAGAAGTDPFGNTYPAGAAFGTSSVGQTKIPPSGQVQLAGADGNNVIVLRPDNKSFALYSDPPGLGALLVSMAAAATTDTFGNTLPQGLQVLAGQYQITPSGVFAYSGTPAAGNMLASIAPAAGTDSFGNAFVQGVASYQYQAGTLRETIQVNNNLVTWIQATTGDKMSLAQDTINSNLFLFGSGSTTSPPLIETGDPSALGTVESWHTFTLQNGTTAGTDVNGTTYTPAYKMLPDGNVALRGVVVSSAGLAAATTWAAIPAAYRPAVNIPVALISNGGRTTFSHVYVRPNGNMQFDAAVPAGGAMWIDCILLVNGT